MTVLRWSGSCAAGALSAVAVLALVTACSSDSSDVRVDNHCDVPIQATFTNLLAKWSEDTAQYVTDWVVDADGAVDIAAGASATLVLGPPPSPATRVDGQAFLSIRGDGGEWLTVAPVGEKAPSGSDVGYIKDGVFVVNDVLCAQVGG